MTVATCPACRESVTVPVDATPQCTVRCPLCHEQFPLAAFLAQLPPSLIVVGDEPDEASAEEERDEAAQAHVLLGSFVSADEDDASAESVPEFDFIASAPEGEAEESPRAASRRGRGRQKNATLEVLKIVAGALLAIPAAQLILWWLFPGPWKRDLFGIGPAVSRVVPWVVPEAFRADEIVAPRRAVESLASPVDQRERPQRAWPRANTGSAQPTGSTHTAHKAPLQPNPSAPADSSATAPTTDSADVDQAPPEGEPAAAKLEVIRGVRGARQFQLADLQSALEGALQASIQWDTDPNLSAPHRTQLTQQFYEAFALLSEAVTYPPPDDPGTRDFVSQLSDTLKSFGKQPKKLAMIGNQAAACLNQPDRPSPGVLLFGTVQQIIPAGSLYETHLELASLQECSVTIVSRVDPRTTFRPGDRILMLGAVVQDPRNNLLGYQGSEPMVVMGGFPVLMP